MNEQDEGAQYKSVIAHYSQALEDAHQARDAAYVDGLEAAMEVLRRWASHYPLDIFPDTGVTIDCLSAKFARHLFREIEKDIKALAPAKELA